MRLTRALTVVLASCHQVRSQITLSLNKTALSMSLTACLLVIAQTGIRIVPSFRTQQSKTSLQLNLTIKRLRKKFGASLSRFTEVDPPQFEKSPRFIRLLSKTTLFHWLDCEVRLPQTRQLEEFQKKCLLMKIAISKNRDLKLKQIPIVKYKNLNQWLTLVRTQTCNS